MIKQHFFEQIAEEKYFEGGTHWSIKIKTLNKSEKVAVSTTGNFKIERKTFCVIPALRKTII